MRKCFVLSIVAAVGFCFSSCGKEEPIEATTHVGCGCCHKCTAEKNTPVCECCSECRNKQNIEQ